MNQKNKQLRINYGKKEKHEHLKVEEQQCSSGYNTVISFICCYGYFFFVLNNRNSIKKHL